MKWGDLSEDDFTQSFLFTDLIDNDKTNLYNTKDLDAFSDEFKNAMVEIATGDKNIKFSDLKNMSIEEQNKIMETIKNNFLQYIPIDLIKGNTIYEVKSFKTGINKEGYQKMGKTKLEGFGRMVKGNSTKYEFDFTDDMGKIKNITFSYKGGNEPKIKYNKKGEIIKEVDNYKFDFTDIPILKNNSLGYKYYWLMSNKDITGYINPLQEKNFLKLSKQMDNSTNFVLVDNKDFKIMPNSYMQLFKERLENKKIFENKRDLIKQYIKKTLIKKE